MQRSLIILVTIVNLLFSGFSLASAALSDFELAAVSGGGIDPHLQGQSLPQQPQQPGSNNANYQPPQPIRNDDGMEQNLEVFAIMQSSADLRRARVLLLKGSTQQQATGLNLDNAVTSDIVSTNNIFDGGDLTVEDVTTAIEINQVNNLTQFHRSQGSLSSSIAGYRHETIVDRESGSESFDYHVFSNIYQQRLSQLDRSDFSFTTVQVGSQFTSLDDFTSNALPLAILSPKEFPVIFDFNVGEVADLGWFGEAGAELDYSGIRFFGPGLDITTIDAGGPVGADLVLGTDLTTPKLDFGDLDIRLCVSTCSRLFWDLGFIGGNTIDFGLVFNDLAPEVQELNLGAGFAFNGSGQLTTDPGIFTINGDVSIKVSPFASLTLDFSKLILLGVDVGAVLRDTKGTDHFNKTWSFDLINKQFPFELLDEDLEIDPVEIVHGDSQQHSEELLAQDNERIEIYTMNDVAESSFNETHSHRVFIGGQMTGAEAELLAMSESNLSVDTNNSISMAGHAQQGMRVFNSVNAVSSVAANAINISRLPVLSGESPAMTQISLLQHNYFSQQR